MKPIIIFVISSVFAVACSGGCKISVPTDKQVVDEARKKMEDDRYFVEQVELACDAPDVDAFWNNFELKSKQEWCLPAWEEITRDNPSCGCPDRQAECELAQNSTIDTCGNDLKSIAVARANCTNTP